MLLKVNDDIVLESLDQKHVAPIFRTLDTYRDLMRIWLPFVDNMQVEDDTRKAIGHLISTGDPTFAVYYRNEFAGLNGIKGLDSSNQRGEIGYWISPAYQNQGIASLTTRFFVDYGFKELNLNRIQIKIGVHNVPSNRVAEKVGFRFEGIERDGERLVSGFHDLNVYSILRREWT